MHQPFQKKIEEAFEKAEIQISKGVTQELEPFLTIIYTMGSKSQNFRIFKENFIYFHEKYKQKREIISSILEGFPSAAPTNIRDMIYMLFTYLGFIESVGNTIVDIIVMLLVVNGRDFHIECRGYRTPRIRHVVSIKKDLERERIPLGMKLSFLRENGIRELTKIIDSKLRNSIAHLKFDIKRDGIYVGKKPAFGATFVALKNLTVAINVVERILNQVAEDRGLLLEENDNE